MKTKIVQITITLLLTYLGLTFVPLAAKASRADSLLRILEVARDWKKTYNFDPKAQANLDAHLNLIADTEALLAHQEIDPDLRGRIEKVREGSLAGIAQGDERELFYLVFEYVLAFRKQMKAGESSDDQVSMNRYKTIEDSIQRIGLKAIPVLTELNTNAVRKNATPLSTQTKELISKIAKKGDLQVEQAKIQVKLNRKENADASNDETHERLAEVSTEHSQLPKLDAQINGIETIDTSSNSFDLLKN